MNLSLYRRKDTLAYLLARCKGRLFPSTKDALFVKSLDLTKDPGEIPEFTLNRGTSVAEQRKRDKTVFMQVLPTPDCKSSLPMRPIVFGDRESSQVNILVGPYGRQFTWT